ncbi:transcription-repair coupling factor [Rickettsia conorii subsp. heilongjiangensis]|uniref:Transcription-repair-coupling factor n=1 Tax=Rickettsia conorii subsp. heilongjiangensis TaxID=226665 RepID=A0AAD1LSZ2_RICCR|nr:transcription-repair coupling factor [Rickettsia conorii]AEK74913.1 transcription-repair coupling factor [Rickettsia conorii subsp. heilongjiangensis 054]BBM91654.1 transcription-repair coupling factor [Rickettsia conorii subsp. heilongjiangensis]BBM92862.1 transcription-repair coupling factor [Rickettsia conorii subsp. heilongjiangensis]BBM94071.1 transcription-repair coupling factor [Rickettsia conorii subsp. heilongjiangensis]BBM95280.1 transcription-repair coupling factor [Rickettsia co
MLQQKFPAAAKSFFAIDNFTKNLKQDFILSASNEEEALQLYKQALFFSSNEKIYYFPSYNTIPYDHTSPNANILSRRAETLTKLTTNNSNSRLLITHTANLLNKLPPKDFFSKYFLKLSPKMKFTTDELAMFLVENSFTRNAISIDVGEFAVRGEIIDIILPGPKAYRIHFSWGYIESIKEFDIDTQISTKSCRELIISPANEIVLNSETIGNFKNNYLRNFGVNHTDNALYEAVISGRKFTGYEQLLPLFYDSCSNLIDYLNDPIFIFDNLSKQAILEFEHSYNDFYSARSEANKLKFNSFYPTLAPTSLYFTASEITELLEQKNNILLTFENSEQASLIENIAATSFIEKKTVFDKLFEVIKANSHKKIIIGSSVLSSFERIKSIIQNYEYKYNEINKLDEAKASMINVGIIPLNQSFYTKEYLFITASELLEEKPRATNTNKKLKNILLELDNLAEGELVVHKDHGIGQFLKLEALEIKGKPHDFLKILYAGNDKLYIPVESIEVIKKYGNDNAELDKLGSVSWQRSKAKLKNRIKEIALHLIQIAAKRKLNSSASVEFDLEEYDKFCANFPFSETEDQLIAINDIKEDLRNGMLMDRLICGDVGFGKTEVAMRAVFMVAKSLNEHLPQVAVVVPTTILCSQHFSRFIERFKGFGLNIKQLSSVISSKEAKIIRSELESGKINIIIGTHSLLHKNIKFFNLKLLIIDEEQHFGVGQKEFLKSLKSSSHVLAMSATPIPRTLQMSMTGLKELSIIATPPLNRLEVRTLVMPFDPVIIRDALLREHFRGGRSFYVVPRIKDIEDITKQLKQIVPELSYKIAYGKMTPSKIDEVMSEFYAGKFDILVSTTIIESGIDIAEANTMIIHNADMLGLSQLYQLRGRIGRGKMRGYAYLTVASHKKMTSHSLRRLEIIQNSCALGSGFTIASRDMDLRGVGNLIGEEQSGQIKEVGTELYQEMLEEQIAILKDEPIVSEQPFIPTINLGLSVFIPDNYVADAALKLGLYRRIGNLSNEIEVETFKDEMIDRFGLLPIEFNNLLDIVKIKLLCFKLNIENLDSGDNGFVIKFYKNADMTDKILKFVSTYSNQAKIKPDNKLVYIKKLVDKNIIVEANQLLWNLSEV